MRDTILNRRPTVAIVDDQLATTLEIIENSFNLNNLADYLLGIETLKCETGQQLEEIAKTREIDLVIADLKMPDAKGGLDVRVGLDVVSFCVQELNAAVIVFSAESYAAAEPRSLEEGADDYIEKFHGRGRIALRTKYWLDRVFEEKRRKSEKYVVSGYVFKPGSRDLIDMHDRRPTVRLSFSEHDLLKLMFRNAKRTVTREEYNVWILKREAETKDRRFDNQIHRLRNKLGDADAFRTIRGGGYRI